MGGGGWTGIRDTLESGAALAGNLYVPGSSAITSGLTSKGAQEELSSPIGKIAQLGSSAYGSFGDTSGLPGGGGSGVLNSLTSQAPAPVEDLSFGGSGVPATANPANVDSTITGGNVSSDFGASGNTGAGLGGTPTADPSGETFDQATGTFKKAIDPATGLPTTQPPGTPQSIPGAKPTADQTSWKDKLFGKMTLPQELSLGMQAASAFGTPKQAPITTDPYGTGAKAAQTTNALLDKFNTGQLSVADQASIAQAAQQQTQTIKAQYAAQGLSGSSMEAQALSQVAVQQQAATQQALNNMLNQANTAAGVTQPYVTSMVTQQISQNKQLQDAQAQFAKLMTQYGMYSMGTPASQPAATL